jgi:mediator of RNA polymerase II transcription subunit 18
VEYLSYSEHLVLVSNTAKTQSSTVKPHVNNPPTKRPPTKNRKKKQKMHELLLFSQISPARHTQVLNILAGVTGSQPFAYQDQCALFAQLRLPEINLSFKKKPAPGTPQPQKWMHKLTRPVQITTNPSDSDESLPGQWRLRVEQTPDPSVKDHTAREVIEAAVPDIKPFLDTASYRLLGQQYILGHRFVSGNVVVRIFRVLVPTRQVPAEAILEGPPLSVQELEIMDASGTFMVEVSVRVEDRKNAKIAQQAVAELMGFKSGVEGVIDLRVPDRLALDTRVKDA